MAISSRTGFASGPSGIDGAALPIVAYSFFGPNPNGSGVEFYGRVYDYANDVLRFSDITLTKASAPKISPDGRFMRLSDNSFYEFNGTSYSLVGSLSGVDFLFFRPDVPDEIVATKNSPAVLYIYDANTLALKRTINPLNGFFKNYDPVTKLAIFTGDNSKTIKAVNIDTGSETIINAYSFYYDRYILLNGVLFTYDGYFIKVF